MTAAIKKPSNVEISYQADIAGLAAGSAHNPTPMQVVQRASAFDDTSPVVKTFDVSDGPCGWAWVNTPGNTSFGRFAVKAGLGRRGYYGGIDIYCSLFNQSVERKRKYCEAYAEVLNRHGIDASVNARLD